jgi:hypothetical protein
MRQASEVQVGVTALFNSKKQLICCQHYALQTFELQVGSLLRYSTKKQLICCQYYAVKCTCCRVISNNKTADKRYKLPRDFNRKNS